MVEVRCSKLDRVMKCAGFSHFKDLVETEGGLPAQEGTAAGELLQHMLEQRTLTPTVGTHAKNGIRFDEEMWFFMTNVAERIFKDAGDSPITCEERIDFLACDNVTIRGQYDACFLKVIENRNILYIDDNKYGWGIVEPKNNWQLIGYAIGKVKKLFKEKGLNVDEVVLRIHQPRPNHEDGWTREWRIDILELVRLNDQVTQQLNAVFNNNYNKLETGSQCKYCPAQQNDACPAFNHAVFNGVDHVLTEHSQDNISERTIAYQLRMFQRIEEIMKIKKDSLEALAINRINSGKIIPGFTTEASYGDRKWKSVVTPASIATLTKRSIMEEKMLSPAKAEKLGISKHFIAGLTERHFIKNKLVQKDAAEMANKIFNNKG